MQWGKQFRKEQGKSLFRKLLYRRKNRNFTKSKSRCGIPSRSFYCEFPWFFPAEKPKYVGLIVFDEPGGETHTGGGIAAPVFREVVESIIPIVEKSEKALVYRLKGEKNKIYKLDPKVMPDLTGFTASETIQIIKQLQVEYKMEGSGFVKTQEPKAGSPLSPNTSIKIVLEP